MGKRSRQMGAEEQSSGTLTAGEGLEIRAGLNVGEALARRFCAPVRVGCDPLPPKQIVDYPPTGATATGGGEPFLDRARSHLCRAASVAATARVYSCLRRPEHRPRG
jgi:hypothetical protein